MGRVDDLERELEILRQRLSRLSDANVRINQSLEFDTVLQQIMDSARALTGARLGLLTLTGRDGKVQECYPSGASRQEGEEFLRWAYSTPGCVEFLGRVAQHRTRRGPDTVEFVEAEGVSLPRLPPINAKCPMAFLAAPIRYMGSTAGNVFVVEPESGDEFSQADEEVLVMFASQAALVIANARRYRDVERARADLELAVNSSPVGIVVFDGKTAEVVSANREIRRIADSVGLPDLPIGQLLEMLTFRFPDGQGLSLDTPQLREHFSTAERLTWEEITIEGPDGKATDALVNVTPVVAADTGVESVVATVQDLSPLQQQERQRVDFAGTAAHELRTPLTAIKGAASTMLESALQHDPTETRGFLRIINDQADRMAALIRDILDVNHIETGTLSVHPEPVDVALLLEDARSMFKSGGRERLEFNLASDLPPVSADRRRIGQVLANLLSNASKASPESSPIRIAASCEDHYVTISVADEGTGLTADRLDRIFQKFTRFADNRNDSEGSGLGLAVSQGIVEAHGGRIWAQSAGADKGAQFTFTIPTAAPASAADDPSPSPTPELEPLKILVVDDDPHALRFARHSLTDSGHTPILTDDPDDVVHLAKQHNPDLVLLDLMLPGNDGINVMNRLLEVCDTPVIFLSAYAQDDVIARALDSGAYDYIVKPYTPTELQARIRAALRRQRTAGTKGPPEPYTLGELTLNYRLRQVTISGQPVRLTTTEYRLLEELSQNAGHVLTHKQLQQGVWTTKDGTDLRPLRTAIKSLRQKLGDNAKAPAYIFTESRTGYWMPGPDTPQPPE